MSAYAPRMPESIGEHFFPSVLPSVPANVLNTMIWSLWCHMIIYAACQKRVKNMPALKESLSTNCKQKLKPATYIWFFELRQLFLCVISQPLLS